MGNFAPTYVNTVLEQQGRYDLNDFSTSEINLNETTAQIKNTRVSLLDEEKHGHQTYEYILSVQTGFLNCGIPLLPNAEVKLSWDRAKACMSLIEKENQDPSNPNPGPLEDEIIDIHDCYLTMNYISSPALRNYFSGISNNPTVYKYDDCSVYLRPLPLGSHNIRLDNIIGGKTPTHLFAGIILSEGLEGSMVESSTAFKLYGKG